MPLDWINVSKLDFNSLLLLERVQLSWLPGWLPEEKLGTALLAHPHVAWYFKNKCPEIANWTDKVLDKAKRASSEKELRDAEVAIMDELNDLLVYVVDPSIYDEQEFLKWDSDELLSCADFADKVVLDIGAGTGRLTLTVADQARTVFAVEPVENLRRYLKEKAKSTGFGNVFVVDGLITDIPFPDSFSDITMSGHAYGDVPAEELAELERVTKPGGAVVLCPGNADKDNRAHQCLVAAGYEWSRFIEPKDGPRRKYWKAL